MYEEFKQCSHGDRILWLVVYKIVYIVIKIFIGEVDKDIDFTFEDNTSVYGSCTATLDGEMWVLGATHNNRQVRTFYMLVM